MDNCNFCHFWHFPCFWLHCAMRMRCRKQPCRRNYFRPVHVGGVISIPVHILILYYACAMVGIRSRELFPVANSTWAEWYPLRCTHTFLFLCFYSLCTFDLLCLLGFHDNYLKLFKINNDMQRNVQKTVEICIWFVEQMHTICKGYERDYAFDPHGHRIFMVTSGFVKTQSLAGWDFANHLWRLHFPAKPWQFEFRYHRLGSSSHTRGILINLKFLLSNPTLRVF